MHPLLVAYLPLHPLLSALLPVMAALSCHAHAGPSGLPHRHHGVARMPVVHSCCSCCPHLSRCCTQFTILQLLRHCWSHEPLHMDSYRQLYLSCCIRMPRDSLGCMLRE
jgi:hypothetical protein